MDGTGTAPAELERTIAAVADPTRRGILLGFLHDATPRTVDEVAESAGVHRTVAFGHLERLAGLGYLVKSKRRGRLGKPAALYSPSVGVLSVQLPARQHLLLGTLLAAGLEGLGEHGQELARSAGLGLGARLGPPPGATVAEALEPLQALGGDYRTQGTRIVAGTCIFREACVEAPAVVCGLHAGILEGALRGAGIEVRVLPAPHPATGGCSFRLTTVPAPAG